MIVLKRSVDASPIAISRSSGFSIVPMLYLLELGIRVAIGPVNNVKPLFVIVMIHVDERINAQSAAMNARD